MEALADIADAMNLPLSESVTVAQMRDHILELVQTTPSETARNDSERAAIAKELRDIAKSGAMIHLLGWDDIQRTCDYAAKLLESAPSTVRALADKLNEIDAERYRFLKTRLQVPHAVARFLRLNNWHPSTDLADIDAAIDVAMEIEKL